MIPEWLVYDAGVSDKAIRLYLALQRHAGQAGECFPSKRRLAKLLNCSINTVDRARGDLVEAGALWVEPNFRDDGSQSSSDYHLCPVPPTPSVGGGGHRAGVPSPPTDDGGDPPKTGVPVKRAISNESQLKKTLPSPDGSESPESTFEDFWSVYPLHKEKTAARGAWVRATRKERPSVLLAAAVAYRDDPGRKEEYTKYPARWLSRGCWTDEVTKSSWVKTQFGYSVS